MESWKKIAKNLEEMERKEIAYHRITMHKMNQAQQFATKQLLDTPYATQTMINKIMNFTIVVPKEPPGIIDGNELYKAYLPHLQKEIQKICK